MLPALFFDAYPDLEDEREAQATIDEVKELVQLTENMQPFPLEDTEVSATQSMQCKMLWTKPKEIRHVMDYL